jgi:hypothetical protein
MVVLLRICKADYSIDMINFERAKEIAKERIGPECDLVEQATIEKSYGWYFNGQSKKFLATGSIDDMLVGSGGFLVERENGRVVEFGSAYPRETWLENYEKGFKYDAYDLEILEIHDFQTALEMLLKLDMQYVIPEWQYGVEWCIPKHYTSKDLTPMLAELPCRFSGQRFWHRVEIFDRINQTQCFTYVLTEHVAS